MGDATWIQALTTGGAIVVLTWIVYQLVTPNGLLTPRHTADKNEAKAIARGDEYKIDNEALRKTLITLTEATLKRESRRRGGE